ncbi:hypothetical protein DY000_02033119 [Brassica cretica]|uniref:Uncharacterized protein n=1 Tax=Brassica cretica TaxID=69181 RepID=A0ABQ7DRD7_BRACR|nr:hypothetical protein DY000_02033119 [Brassica cretica]
MGDMMRRWNVGYMTYCIFLEPRTYYIKNPNALTFPGTGLEVLCDSMRSGAGDAFSRRRWPFPTMLSSVFISLLVSRFISRVLRSRSVLLTGERGSQQSFQWRQELWFVVFTAVLLTAPPLWWVSSPTMSREGSLTTVVLWFTGTFSGEPFSGCRRTSHTVDYFVLALQLLMEFRSQRTNSRFPPPGSETTNQLGVALFHLYDARIHDNSSLDPDLIRSSSLSSPLSVLSSSPVCSLLNRGSAYLHRPSPSPFGFDGNPPYLSKLVSPPASAIYLSVDVIRTISDLQPRSMTSHNFPAYAFASELRSIRKWAWPNSFAEAYNQIIKILKARLSVQDVRYLAVGLNSLDNLKISHGFIGVYNLRLLQYHFFRKNLSSSSSNEESISPPYLPSMNGDVLLGSIPSFCFNSLTGLSPCVAVCTGPEGAIENTLVLLVGGGCPSTSLVTISQLSDFVVKVLQTHSSIVLNPLF